MADEGKQLMSEYIRSKQTPQPTIPYAFDENGGLIFPRNLMEYEMQVKFLVFKEPKRLLCAKEPGTDPIDFDELPERTKDFFRRYYPELVK